MKLKWIKSKNFKEKSHYELGERLGMLDFDLATKTTGSRFVFVKDKLAMLERALTNFMLDIHTLENGYREISPPLMALENTMYGTGQLPKFENDQFEILLNKDDDRKFLIPTAEVILTNMVKNKIVDLMIYLKDLSHQHLVLEKKLKLREGYERHDKTTSILQSWTCKHCWNENCLNELERMTKCYYDFR